MDITKPALQLQDVQFTWPGAALPVIDIPQLQIEQGERVFVRGASGSGKTTLLSLIAAILKPQRGSIVVNAIDITAKDAPQADQFRADHIGLVFQQFNLLPFLSVTENVQLPCKFSPTRRKQAVLSGGSTAKEAERLLDAMQLPKNVYSNASTMRLSVGQQQRVAVARALIGSPKLVIADEPTSALDTDARDAFLKLLFNEVEQSSATLLFVSHDSALATMFDRNIDLRSLNRASTDTQHQAESVDH